MTTTFKERQEENPHWGVAKCPDMAVYVPSAFNCQFPIDRSTFALHRMMIPIK